MALAKEANMKRFFMGSGVFLLGFLLLVGMGFMWSQAKPVPPAVKVLSIPAPAFEMPREDVQYTNNGRVFLEKTAEYIRAPLVVPNGTVITKVELICKDAHATKAMKLWIHAYSNDGSKTFTMCLVESVGSAIGWRTFTTTAIKPSIIDNENNFYFLNLYIPEKGQAVFEFCGVKVYYTGTW
jgi:hypothetical protein